MNPPPVDRAASIRARLLNIARDQGVEFNQVLVRFALERMLYRLSRSEHADRFLLKGALLFTLWYGLPHRATRDADLLGYGASDPVSITRCFRDIAALPAGDGIRFLPDSVSAAPIREQTIYGGVRVILSGELANARCRVQLDIGFGDAVTPAPVESVYPVLLDELPAPRLRTYPIHTVIAEKVHAIALMGMANGRLKDYYDLAVMIEREDLDVDLVAAAVRATFARRGLPIPQALPVGLSDEFGGDASRQAMWGAFLRKNGLAFEPLPGVVARLAMRLWPTLIRAAR